MRNEIGTDRGLVINNPKVSVVMPTHNRAKELPKSIQSVLSQSFSDFEFIIIDDASTDNTEDVVNGFKDCRIIYKKLINNVGAAEARNVGIRFAKADIVAFQDSDDEWTSSKLEISLRELTAQENIGAVFSKFIQVSHSGCRLMPVGVYTFDPDNVYLSLLWQNHVGTPTLVAKKKYIDMAGGFTKEMPRYQDWELALNLARITEVKYIEQPMLLSYVTAGSITQNEAAHGKALELLYEQHHEVISEDKELEAAWFYRLGDAQICNGDRTGLASLFKAWIRCPNNIRYLVKLLFALPRNRRIYISLTRWFKREFR